MRIHLVLSTLLLHSVVTVAACHSEPSARTHHADATAEAGRDNAPHDGAVVEVSNDYQRPLPPGCTASEIQAELPWRVTCELHFGVALKSIAVAPSGGAVAVSVPGRRIGIWGTSDYGLRRMLAPPEPGFAEAMILDDDENLWIALAGRMIRRASTDGAVTAEIPLQRGRPLQVSADGPDGFVLALDAAEQAYVVAADDGAIRARLRSGTPATSAVRAGSAYAVGDRSGFLHWFAGADAAQPYEALLTRETATAAISSLVADSKVLVSAALDGRATHWDVPRQTPIAQVQLRRPLVAAALNADGTTVAIGDNEGEVYLFSLPGLLLHSRGVVHPGAALRSLAWSGATLISAGEDGRVVFLDIADPGVASDEDL